jgi:NADH-quinone oxidoreductase subunit H
MEESIGTNIMESVLYPLIYFLIFPGFLFTSIVGLLASWIDRKVTARVQWRVGPPWYQPFVDLFKLLGKETMVPAGPRATLFLVAPLVGLVGVTLVSTIVWVVNLNRGSGFLGDLIVVLYLFTLPALAVIIGGSASKNPLGALGASREMKLVLGYELPFIIAVFTVVVKIGSMLFQDLLIYQDINGIMLRHPSGIIAFIVAIICAQAKLTLIPFDIPEAEQEIMAGPFVEYSGAPLAIFKLTRAMMLFTVPIFMITVFWGGLSFSGWNILWTILKYVALLVIIVVIRNTNPRVRIDQAIRFMWGPMTILAIIGMVLAALGF